MTSPWIASLVPVALGIALAMTVAPADRRAGYGVLLAGAGALIGWWVLPLLLWLMGPTSYSALLLGALAVSVVGLWVGRRHIQWRPGSAASWEKGVAIAVLVGLALKTWLLLGRNSRSPALSLGRLGSLGR